MKPDVLEASRFPSLVLAITRIIDVILLDIHKRIRIWSTLDGYEKLAQEFEAISNGHKHVPATFLGIWTCLRW